MNIQKFGTYLFSLLILFSLVGVSFALTAEDTGIQIEKAICEIVCIVEMVMGAVMLILIVLAAIIYAAGQVLGAETRARANVWATTMFVGAIVGGLIYLVVPIFINTLTSGSFDPADCSCFGGAPSGIPAGGLVPVDTDPPVIPPIPSP